MMVFISRHACSKVIIPASAVLEEDKDIYQRELLEQPEVEIKNT